MTFNHNQVAVNTPISLHLLFQLHLYLALYVFVQSGIMLIVTMFEDNALQITDIDITVVLSNLYTVLCILYRQNNKKVNIYVKWCVKSIFNWFSKQKVIEFSIFKEIEAKIISFVPFCALYKWHSTIRDESLLICIQIHQHPSILKYINFQVLCDKCIQKPS